MCVCVLGESRCSGADSSALCILKPPSPPAAKIELGGCMGGGGREGGEGRREWHSTPGSPFLIAPLGSVYLIRHDQENRGRERQGETSEREKEGERWVWRIGGDGQTGSNFSSVKPQSLAAYQIFVVMGNKLIACSSRLFFYWAFDCFSKCSGPLD